MVVALPGPTNPEIDCINVDKNNWFYFKSCYTFRDSCFSVLPNIKLLFQIFQGNNDVNSGIRHNLANQIETSYVRIIPITWNKNICMRISLLGCEAGENYNSP